MRHTFPLLLALALLLAAPARSQQLRRLTHGEVIQLAQAQSPDAIAARHSYKAAYWNYRNYKADYLPALDFSATPNINRTTDYVTLPDGGEAYVRRNNLKTDLTLNINQHVWFTGGTFSLSGFVRRLDLLGDKRTTYNTQPLMLTYQQNLFGYNHFKWNRRIEPIRYREAQKQYTETMELVAAQASNYFFGLATAQANLMIAQSNKAAADTLYRFALGRYRIGTITENELLQLEVNKLTEETNMLDAQLGLDNAVNRLRSYLNLQDNAFLEVVTDSLIPHFTVPLDEAMQMALDHNPEIESMQLQRLQSQSNLARTKADVGLKADIYLRVGLSQTGNDFAQSFHHLLDEQYVSVGLRLPILDWGKGRGRIQMARSNVELVNTRMDQARINFEQRVQTLVKQFNLQESRTAIAYRTMRTAAHRYEVAHQLYLMGKSTILDLNAAIREKDGAHRSYIYTLSTYWDLYYTLRSLTGYDFQHHCPIAENYPIVK